MQQLLIAMLDSGSISASNAEALNLELEDTASIIEEHL